VFVAVAVESDVLTPGARQRRWLGLRARLQACQLDYELSTGTSPESSDLLFAHAVRIASPRSCAALASSLRKVAIRAQKPIGLSNRAPLQRVDVLHAKAELLALAERLDKTAPIQARGVAQIRRLLGNASGPLYSGHTGSHLVLVLREASMHL
jgi:hypothetical protein